MIESKDLIEATYGIKVTSIKPCRAGYIIDTNIGRKHIRQCQCSENRILYVHAAKEHLYSNGFTNLIHTWLLWTISLMEIDGQNFVITPYFDARECEFSDDGDTIKAQLLLRTCTSQEKALSYENDIIPSDLGKLPREPRKTAMRKY